jgi:predicted nucleotidyltransferase
LERSHGLRDVACASGNGNNALVLSVRAAPPDLDARIEALAAAWAERPQLAAAYLFGSRARGTAQGRSDVDLAVVLAAGQGAQDRFRARLMLEQEAVRRLGTDAVDVLVLEDAPAVVAQRALRDGRLLFDRLPRRRVEVVEAALRRFLDQAPVRAALDRGLAGRVREGRFAR